VLTTRRDAEKDGEMLARVMQRDGKKSRRNNPLFANRMEEKMETKRENVHKNEINIVY